MGRSAPGCACDDLRLAGLKLIFLIVTRAVSLLGLSRDQPARPRWPVCRILAMRRVKLPRASLTARSAWSRWAAAARRKCRDWPGPRQVAGKRRAAAARPHRAAQRSCHSRPAVTLPGRPGPSFRPAGTSRATATDGHSSNPSNPGAATPGRACPPAPSAESGRKRAGIRSPTHTLRPPCSRRPPQERPAPPAGRVACNPWPVPGCMSPAATEPREGSGHRRRRWPVPSLGPLASSPRGSASSAFASVPASQAV